MLFQVLPTKLMTTIQLLFAAIMDDWGLKAGAIGVVLAAIGKFYKDRAVEKREQAAIDAKEKREQSASDARLQELRDIKNSNNRICELLQAQIGKLETVVAVNGAHHHALVNAVSQCCKAQPSTPVNQQK